MKALRLVPVLLLLAFVFGITDPQELAVLRIKENTYAIQLHSFSKKNKLVWSAFPDSWGEVKPLVLKSGHDTLSILSAHPILRLTDKKKNIYAAPRAIFLQGAINFRDLGGYLTNDAKQVKWGKIYRSADISKLTDKDVDVLASLNVKMVCDLRGEKEVETAPDKQIPGSNRILLSAGSENIGGAGSFMKYMTSPQRADSMMRSFYTRTDHLKAKYKPVFDQLLALETDKALMIHCTAGKDRTGVGAALILYALGVNEETIIKDYELTNQYRKELNEQTVKLMTAQGVPENSARSMMAAKAEYLNAAFDAIKKQFGSVDLFLEKEIGLDAGKRKLLQSKFLY
jgi:protein-tyrosine phosphatase